MQQWFVGLLSFGMILVCVQQTAAQSPVYRSSLSDRLSATKVLSAGDIIGLETSSLNRSDEEQKPTKPKKKQRKKTTS